MGFPEDRAKMALKYYKNNFDRAMDYLINNDESKDYKINVENFHRSSSSSFTPDEDNLKMLMEMGYGRSQSVYALRITSNNLEHACNYLMQNGGRGETMHRHHHHHHQ
mmetsp:Transcript_27082/g.26146  ORF Transcript_27082/g.26146 Transcript_27082/m.26146 type:complete len:108 (+) Transcript_27082:816-1139(+)